MLLWMALYLFLSYFCASLVLISSPGAMVLLTSPGALALLLSPGTSVMLSSHWATLLLSSPRARVFISFPIAPVFLSLSVCYTSVTPNGPYKWYFYVSVITLGLLIDFLHRDTLSYIESPLIWIICSSPPLSFHQRSNRFIDEGDWRKWSIEHIVSVMSGFIFSRSEKIYMNMVMFDTFILCWNIFNESWI